MREYKSSAAALVKNAVFGVVGGAAAGFALGYVFGPAVGAVAGVVLVLAALYFTVYQDNITITLDGERLCVLRFGKKLAEFPLAAYRFEVGLQAQKMMGRAFGGTGCVLYVAKPGGKPQQLDCGMLGRKRFMELLQDLAGETGGGAAVKKDENAKGKAVGSIAEIPAETPPETDD